MNKQIISKTLLMTGLVMLAANASTLPKCAKEEIKQCKEIELSKVDEKERLKHCRSYHETNGGHYNCVYLDDGDNNCKRSAKCM